MPETDSANLSFERERGVCAIQVTRDAAHAVIAVGADAERNRRILEVFQTLAAAGVPVFLIKLHHSAVTLAFAGADLSKAQTALSEAGFRATTRRDLALIAVRADSMRDLSGVMVQIADALYEAGARLYETGDSHNSVQCLIEDARVEVATDALRRAFRLEASAVGETSLDAEAAA